MRIIQAINILGLNGFRNKAADSLVKGVSCNSKEVKPNFIFVAIRGNRQDGNKFILEAIEKGALAVVTDVASSAWKKYKNIVFIRVNDARKALARLASFFYGEPSSKIRVIGITGTNGKTTVSYLLESIVRRSGFSPCVIGTINYRFGKKVMPSKNTTPGPVELQSFLSDMAKKNAQYAMMEVSSHALDQDRVLGIDFSSAIFTNLTQDHLDYHKNMQDYFKAKAKLFKNLKSGSFAVINNDDKYGRRLKKLNPQQDVITYGIRSKAEVTASHIKLGISGSEFLLTHAKIKTIFKIPLIGEHNVYNALSAIAWGLKEGLDIEAIKSGIESFSFVPGRLEKIKGPGGFHVFVDYAHTEDALKNAICSLRQVSRNEIIVVFGCGGDRDKTKRPKMGAVVSRLADYAIITNDNPRFEGPLKIIADIKKGIRKNNYIVIPDRLRAIKKSLVLAKSQDIVLIAGKGHEEYQIVKNKLLPFDDRKVVRECLRSMK